MSVGRWKRQEREITAMLGTTRLPNIGAGQPCCRASGIANKIKTRRELSGWLADVMAQAARDCHEGEQLAVIHLHLSQSRKARPLLVHPFEDWTALTGHGSSDQPSRPPSGEAGASAIKAPVANR